MAYNPLFDADIKATLKRYPALGIVKHGKERYLKGIFDICNKEKECLGSFAIEIKGSIGYPFEFPVAYEVGGDIPAEPDFHKYQDNSLCIDVRASEIMKCHSGITIVRFIENELIPFLANQLYRKEVGQYLNEYSHGISGIREFYCELFKTDEVSLWIRCVKHAFSPKEISRNDICYCGSGIKYKKCHKQTDEKLKQVGKEQILNDFKLLRIL